MELISIKMHSEADYPSVTHADYGFTDQASRIAGVIRIKERESTMQFKK